MDLYVVNTLMRLYGVCGRIEDVRKVFDESPQWDLVSWTTLIQGYVDNGLWQEGVKLFFDMCEAGYRADEKMMAVVISAFAKLGDLSLGRKLHEYICNQGVNFDVYVGNSLVDMYLKCGDIESACKVFNQMPVRNVVSWNSMILGLADSGDYEEALRVFRKMLRKGIEPDEVTLVGVLNSCANLGVLELGKWIHAYVDKNRNEVDGFIGNALIDMYAKCGSIDNALEVFEDIKRKDVYTYTAVIGGLAMHGKGEMALKLFSEMCELGIQPNKVTFIGVLTACCHAGLVDEGRRHFAEMSKLYNIKPTTEHYGCIVNLLGRAGLISEAAEYVENMPIKPDVLIWGSLLGACRIHGKLDLAERVMKKLIKVEPEEDGTYVLMSNIYASEKKWRDAFHLRKRMKKGKIKKIPGCSSIDLDGVVYEFRRGDKAHAKSKEIYMLLDKMKHHLDDTNYLIDNCVYLQ
ncbi:Pentatricopeptide repeat-containing protein [Forsythia ovata]|uniref:Pentatricopeptide repeat-containing protein n=1 Tax=Forsythia ovata TaxID=205694 RepID=A0ABD1VH68_9LAMI